MQYTNYPTNFTNYPTHSELMEQIEEGIEMGYYPFAVQLSDGTQMIMFGTDEWDLEDTMEEWNESNETHALSYEFFCLSEYYENLKTAI